MLDNWCKKHIHGIEKILAVRSDFDWHYFEKINQLSYYRTYHKYNDYSYPISCLEIGFSLNTETPPLYLVSMVFYRVTTCCFQFGDTPIHLHGFTIYDNKNNGYEMSSRFHIGSYEQDDHIDFYCESFEVVSVSQCGELDDL